MRFCSLCKKRFDSGTGNLFHIPKDPIKRAKWSKICGKNFAVSHLICVDHFLPTSIIRTGNKVLLLPKSEPFVNQKKGAKYYSNNSNGFLVNGSQSDQISTTYDAIPTSRELFTNPLNRTAASPSSTWAELAPRVNSTQQYTKEKETQTDIELSKLQYIEKVRVLESEQKDLQLKLSQAQTAVGVMRQIFTEGQIRKLMSPGGILWKKEDIVNAACLHTAGPRAYDYLYKKGFPLPHVSTLQRWAPKNKANETPSGSTTKSLHATADSILEEDISVSAFEVKTVLYKIDNLKDRQNVENSTKSSDSTENLPLTVKKEIIDIDDVSANINCSEPIVVKEEIKEEVEFDETNAGDVGINNNVLGDISDYIVEKIEFEEFECNASSVSWIGEISKRSAETPSDGFTAENNSEVFERQESSLSWLNNPIKQTNGRFAQELEGKLYKT